MVNWFKKISWNTGIPTMEDMDKRTRDPYSKDTRSLVNAEPQFGGEKRKGYPQYYKSQEDQEPEDVKDLPSENVLMDQDPPTGEGAGWGDLTERFTDDIDKLKRFDKKPDPIGPHNMASQNIYKIVSKRSKLKNFGRI
jgi:hypothetical protein